MKDNVYYQSILEALSEGVMLLGLDGTIESMNLAAKLIFGSTSKRMIGRKIGSVFYENSENDDFNQAVLEVIYNPLGTHYRRVNYCTGKETLQLYMTTSYLRDGDEPVGIIVVLGDITELADAEIKYARQITELLDSLVTALSIAIDERSPYTANHTRNMVKLGEAFLDWLEDTANSFRFDEDRRHAFLMSVWLHDVGKLTVPLSIMDKATRLGDDLERVESRFEKMRLLRRIDMLEGRASREEYARRRAREAAWLDAIRRINTAPFLAEDDMNIVQEISQARFTDEAGDEQLVLLPSEAEKLLIRKGTLTDGERKAMQGHASATRRILNKVKFPQAFAMVPDWASEHHELLGGTGYPQHMSGELISREVRLLTILDIFEALTAKDRPYKKPMSVERSLEILYSMAKEGSVDEEILGLFAESKAWEAIL